MTTRGADSPAQVPAKRLQFDRYVLDLDRGCLLLDGTEIALRPKTFAVLRYLIENSGRLVSKDELFAAVWPNLAVTDDALVQSIGELRRALDDDGPRLIRTIPRRGYRFEPDTPVDASIRPSVGAILFTTVPARKRVGLFASLALAVLLAAGVLWIGTGTDFGTFWDPVIDPRPSAPKWAPNRRSPFSRWSTRATIRSASTSPTD
jgi:DNA-binding winged helix-turn-helix (wHTH) protein